MLEPVHLQGVEPAEPSRVRQRQPRECHRAPVRQRRRGHLQHLGDRLEQVAGDADQLDQGSNRRHRRQGRGRVGGVRLHGAQLHARGRYRLGPDGREPARTCVQVHGERWRGEPVPVVQHQPDDRLLPRPRRDLRRRVHRRERHRLAGRAERHQRSGCHDRRQHNSWSDDGHDGGQRDLLVPAARGRLVHGVLRLTRLRLRAVRPDIGSSLPRRSDRLQLPGPFDRLDHELLRVPAARLGRRHGLQRREPEPGQR